ncbi:hypothetical protein JTB14_011958 [Gonioctena quinquepunctata]|nr:hypothetical protein JTB14_011958 [Gonioctena quinquepunctata]
MEPTISEASTQTYPLNLGSEPIDWIAVNTTDFKGVSLEEVDAISHGLQTTVEIFTTSSSKTNIPFATTTDGVMVSSPGSSYRDKLGKVTNVKGKNKDAEHIRYIRSAKDGKLIMTLDKDASALEPL